MKLEDVESYLLKHSTDVQEWGYDFDLKDWIIARFAELRARELKA